MSNKRDVELVIRARNEATKALDSVTAALNEITESSRKFKSGADTTDTLLGAIGQQLAKLQQSSSGNAFEKLAQGAEKAETAVTTLEQKLAKTQEEAKTLASSLKAAEQAQTELAAKSEQASAALARENDTTQRLKDQLKEVTSEIKKYESELDKRTRKDASAAGKIEELNGKLAKAAERHRELALQMAKTDSPTKRLQSSFEAAGRALETQQTRLVKAKAAQAENSSEMAKASARLDELKAKLPAVTAAYERAQAELNGQKNVLKEVQGQLSATSKRQVELAGSLQKTEQAAEAQSAALVKAKAQLSDVWDVTAQADAATVKMASTLRLQLLRALDEARTKLAEYQRAQQQATSRAASIAATPGGTSSPEFSSAVAQARAAKQAYQEQRTAVELMRRELRSAGTDVQALSAAQQRFTTIQAKANATVSQGAANLDRLGDEAQQSARAHSSAATAVDRHTAQLQRMASGARQTLSYTQRLRGEVLSLIKSYAGLYAAMAGTRGVAGAYMTLEAAQNRLGAVFQQNTARVSQEIDWLMDQADRLGIEFGVLSDAYAKFAVAADAANYSSEATRRVFLSVAEAGRVNKLSMENMQGIFLALEQMISKGKVSSEELRRQLGDRLPGAFTIMADALDMTAQELDAALQAGEVFSSQDNLLKFADELDQRFGKQLPDALKSFTTQWGRFQNEIFKAELRAGEAGFIEGMREALESLTTFFRSSEGQKFFNGLGSAAGTLAKMLALVVENLDTVVTIMAVMASRKITSYVQELSARWLEVSAGVKAATVAQTANNSAQAAGAVQAQALATRMAVLRTQTMGVLASTRAAAVSVVNMARGFSVATAAARAAAAAMGFLRTVMATLGGPIGLVITGASLLLTEWAFSADQATTVTSELSRQVDALGKAYRDANGDIEKAKGSLESLTQLQAEENLQKIKDRVASAFGEIRETLDQSLWSARTINRGAEGVLQITEAFDEMESSLAQGLVPDLEAFRRVLDEVGRGDDSMRPLAAHLLEVIDSAKDGETSLADLVAALRKQLLVTQAITGSAEEQKAAMAELFGAVDGGVSGTIDATEMLNAAFEKLNQSVPQTKAELEKLAKIKGLKDILSAFDDVDMSTWDTTQLGRYKELVDAVMSRIQEIEGEDAAKLAESIREANAEREFQLKQQKLINAGLERQAEINAALRQAEQAAARKGLTLSEAQRASIARTTAALYDQKVAQERLAQQQQAAQAIAEDNANREFQLQQAKLEASGQGRQAAINAAIRDAERQAAKAQLTLTQEQRQEIERTTAALYDQQNAVSVREQQEARINQLVQMRSGLMQAIEFAEGQGDQTTADALGSQLANVTTQLQEAIQLSREFWATQQGPEAEAALINLQNLENSLVQVGSSFMMTAEEINQSAATMATSQLRQFTDQLVAGENAIEALGDAFRNFAIEFLNQIAQMIIQQIIFNALKSAGFGGGVGGVAGAIVSAGVNHTGGLAGSAPATRAVPASVFAGAMRYHNGGIPGLKANEVPTILEKGEEVLPRDDPRHALNGGGSSGQAQQPVIVNTIDAGSFISEGLNTTPGQKAIFNLIRANRGQIKSLLT